MKTFSFNQAYMIVMATLVITFGSMAVLMTYHGYKRELKRAVVEVEQDLGSRSANAQLALAAMKDRKCSNLEQLQAKQDLDKANESAREAIEAMEGGSIASSLWWTAMAADRYQRVSVENCKFQQEAGR
jgi:hypothetical protein